MSFHVIITSDLEKTLRVLKRKDKKTFLKLKKKMIQIAQCDSETISHYKNLKGALKAYKRVHIGSQVLIFRVKEDTIVFEVFDHHDNVYKIK